MTAPDAPVDPLADPLADDTIGTHKGTDVARLEIRAFEELRACRKRIAALEAEVVRLHEGNVALMRERNTARAALHRIAKIPKVGDDLDAVVQIAREAL